VLVARSPAGCGVSTSAGPAVLSTIVEAPCRLTWQSGPLVDHHQQR
jgi:hypothetical protein